MNDNDYIILFDEYGQPYIAHSIKSRFKSAYGRVKSGVKSAGEGMGRGWRASTKYLLKVGEGAKAQYAYTQAEVDRLMGRGRKAIGQAAAKVKQTASNAAQKGRQALSTASSKVRDYSARTSDAIRRHGSETLKTVKDYANQASNKVKDVAGVDERERRDAAWKKLGDKIDTSSEKSRDAWKDFEKARSEYMKTPLGKIEYTAERAKEILTGQDGNAKEIAEDLVERAKDKASEVADRAKDAAKKASDTVKDKASDVADRAKDAAKKASDTIRDKLGYDEKERMENAQKEFDKKYEEGLRLGEEREPIRKEYWNYVNTLEQKYGNGLKNIEEKMSDSERTKYERLYSDLSDISERWWDATVIQMYPSHILVSPNDEPETLWDKLDAAKREYQNTPLYTIEEFSKKIKKK